jgi:glycosyltransferase involved in cell wall biosynthesis
MQVVWQRYLELERHPLKRLSAWLEYTKLRRWEAGAHRRPRKVLAVSAHDASVLQSLCPGLDVEVVPNTVDVNQYHPTSSDDGSSIVFVGGMDWFPNLDAARFFIDEIFPAVTAAFPAAHFAVAGRSPAPAVRAEIERPGVSFLGRLPDVREAIAPAAVCVVPLRIGSGRWRILEAAAMGKAVVSTTPGVEGLEFTDGKAIVLADAPADFARAVVELLRDEARRRALGDAARKRVERHYSATVLRGALSEALAEFEPSDSQRLVSRR